MDDSINKKYLSNLSMNAGASASYVGVASTAAAHLKKNELNYKHLINFNQLAEKLKKIQKSNHAAPTPTSSTSPSKSKKSTDSTSDLKKQHLIYPRSVSTFDNSRLDHNIVKPKVNKKFSYNSIDRNQVQQNKMYSSSRNLKSEQAPFRTEQQPTSKSSKKHKSELSFHSSVASSSSLSSFESESFEMSCSASSTSSLNSFYCDKKSSVTNFPEPIKNKQTNNNNTLRSKYGMSTNNVENYTPGKQILIRREKSIGYMQQAVNTNPMVYSNKPAQIASSSFNTLYYNHSINNTVDESFNNTPKLSRSKQINKNSKSSSSSSNNEESKLKILNKINTSSTTSGVESNSKNSNNYDNEATNKESRSDIVDINTDKTDSISSTLEINELKNRLFIVENDLSNERKKLMQEKDLKKYITFEMKNRYEAEKTAALKALEAKLNAEKLYELNKLKEIYDQKRRDEIDSKQKAIENQILNLKLKLREKSEKCSNFEKLLEEEQNKNNQLFSKSIEIVHKYNQEIKNISDKNQKSSELLSSQTQTSFDANSTDSKQHNKIDSLNLKKRLFSIHTLLSNQTYSIKAKDEIDLSSLLNQIESLAKFVCKSLNESKSDTNILRDQFEKLSNDYTSCKEAKLKVEALYKVKCKSDLNKSAQIKKCQINYDLELMKFRNEFNFDLVRHLENQLSIKDAELIESNTKLDNVSNLMNNFNCFDNHSNNCKDFIKSLFNILNATNDAYKKAPLNVLFIKETDSIKKNPTKNENKSIEKNQSNKKVEIEKVCNEKNKQLQDEMTKLDRQLNEMKSLKIKLAKEKQELLELNKESLNKPKMNLKRDASVDSTLNTSSNNINNNKDTFSNF